MNAPPQVGSSEMVEESRKPRVLYTAREVRDEPGSGALPDPGWYAPPTEAAEVLVFDGAEPWQTDLCCAWTQSPLSVLFGWLFPCVVVNLQRRDLMDNEVRRYICCAGIFGEHFTTHFCPTRRCEGICLFLESVYCLPCAVFANRWMVRQYYNLQRTCFDSSVQGVTCCCAVVGAATGFSVISLAFSGLYCLAVGCVLGQNAAELAVRNYPSRH